MSRAGGCFCHDIFSQSLPTPPGGVHIRYFRLTRQLSVSQFALKPCITAYFRILPPRTKTRPSHRRRVPEIFCSKASISISRGDTHTAHPHSHTVLYAGANHTGTECGRCVRRWGARCQVSIHVSPSLRLPALALPLLQTAIGSFDEPPPPAACGGACGGCAPASAVGCAGPDAGPAAGASSPSAGAVASAPK